jgi:DNA polymerase-3 subunit epsilon
MTGVCIDIETTGFSRNDSIISITLLKFTGYQVDDIFSTLVNPGRAIPEFITDITGINNTMILGFPSFNGKLTDDIKSFLRGHKLYAYNAPFESKFMKNIYFREVEVIDVMNPIRKHFKFDKNLKLIEAAKYFKLETRSLHTSLSDALTCFNLINILNRNGYVWEI